MSRVDLPMPGSPPTSVTEPGTIPPPSTKSNSARPVRQRSTAAPATADSRMGGWPDGALRSADPPIRPTGSSTNEFQAPHASHFPPHFGWSAPHSVQRNTDLPLDTDRSLAGGVVVEAGEFLLEVQLHRPRRAIALLSDDHFGKALDALVRLGVDRPVVELLPVDEADDIGVLLDGARLAEVGKLRAAMLPAALLGRPGQLRDRDDRNVELFGERLERPRDVGDLLLAILDVAWARRQLQIVNDHERNVVLGLQPACLRAHRERRERGGIVNPDRGRAEQARRAGQLGIIVVAQLPAAQPLSVDQALGADQALHELVVGHFQ